MASSGTTKLDFVTLDVFTDTRFLGNPLAVVFVPAAVRDRISQETKQRIAREFNLSETVFLHTLDHEPNTSVTTREIDIFTTETELPFAGHPTIGSAYLVLHHLGWTHVNTLQTKAGPIRIESPRGRQGDVRAAIPHAVHIHRQTLGSVLDSPSATAATTAAIRHGLSTDAEIRAAELAAPAVSIVRGMTFLLVRLPSLEHLARAAPVNRLDFDQLPDLLDRGEWHESFTARYYYVPQKQDDDGSVVVVASDNGGRRKFAMQTRMVELGFEDPATGSAACTLASYLTISEKAEKGAHFGITQGVEMGRRSEIAVDVVAQVDDSGAVKVKELYLGGTAVAVMSGSVSAASRQKVGDGRSLEVASRKSQIASKQQPHPTSRGTAQDIKMLCALSGEVPEEPVVSKKTGIVFEKRLILKYIEENGKEPGTDDELDPEDLLPVKTSRVVRPRPPNFTSLPSLLKAFQDEWDALVLDTYNTREQLSRTREELATALYQHDAAVRVIARLTRERDEAREALSTVTVAPSSVGAPNGDSMVVDNESLPEALVEHVHELQAQLMKGRKRRPVPKGWASAGEVTALQQVAYTDLTVSQASSLDTESEYAAIGGLDGKVDIYSTQENKVERSLDIGEPVTATAWTGSKVIVATSKGSVKVFDSGSETASFQVHAGAVTGLSVHPGGRILASVGVDKSFVFYDLESLEKVSRGYTDAALTACTFHPDGNLFGAGTQAGDIKIFKTETGEQAESYDLGSPVQTLVFSENGYWFAAAGKGQSTTALFDLRKSGPAALVKELQTGDAQALAWDYSGQYLATAGSTGVTVQMYQKSAKAWSEPLRTSTPATALRWGAEAKSLVTVSKEGVVSVLGAKEEE
ncbi:hypothetical protein C8A00DRAFT_42389 [Chaetomidium leptoderma]|uniref:Pre-mRNA-processing factor 19 n=1 Tax=Chaetomidium leptoderma TaxID=669021 RepID=A0AAN6VR95_9PEZI|nr:hypothetical protein C8A00DRAFT_42389 [Chaetomidium leptoderma]